MPETTLQAPSPSPLTSFTEDEIMFRDNIRQFADDKVRPLVKEMDEKGVFDKDLIHQFFQLGLMGIEIPEQYGGLDLSMEDECLVGVELGRTSPAFRSAFGTNVGIGSQGLVMFGTDEQKAKWLPGIASGELVTSFALTEPEAGSDSAAVQTRAVRDGDDYVLNGEKIYVTSGERAELVVVWATLDRSAGRAAIKSFVVERSNPGLVLERLEHKLGIRASDTAVIIFDDCRVPAANILGNEEIDVKEGFAGAMATFDASRPADHISSRSAPIRSASSAKRSTRMARAPSSAVAASATFFSGLRKPAATAAGSFPGCDSRRSASGCRPASLAISALVRRFGL